MKFVVSWYIFVRTRYLLSFSFCSDDMNMCSSAQFVVNENLALISSKSDPSTPSSSFKGGNCQRTPIDLWNQRCFCKRPVTLRAPSKAFFGLQLLVLVQGRSVKGSNRGLLDAVLVLVYVWVDQSRGQANMSGNGTLTP